MVSTQVMGWGTDKVKLVSLYLVCSFYFTSLFVNIVYSILLINKLQYYKKKSISGHSPQSSLSFHYEKGHFSLMKFKKISF